MQAVQRQRDTPIDPSGLRCNFVIFVQASFSISWVKRTKVTPMLEILMNSK